MIAKKTFPEQCDTLMDFYARELIAIVCEYTDVPFCDPDAVYKTCAEIIDQAPSMKEKVLLRLRHHLAIV